MKFIKLMLNPLPKLTFFALLLLDSKNVCSASCALTAVSSLRDTCNTRRTPMRAKSRTVALLETGRVVGTDEDNAVADVQEVVAVGLEVAEAS